MAEQSLGTARIDVTVDISQLQAAAELAKRSVTGMSAAAQDAYNKLDPAEKRRVDRLIHQANTLNMTRQEQLAYNAALRAQGPILDEIIQKLARNESRLKATASQFNKYGLTAKMEAAALRQVPAQLTDIFVSLQGGQAPLTVLLQQGGQLRDLFGGIVPAARALGGALLGLINPVTLTAGAIVGVAAAWNAATKEAAGFERALAETGGYAGMAASQLSDLARELDNISGVTARRASEALTAGVASGQLFGESLRLAAEASAAWSAATGKETKEVIDQFAKLAQDPQRYLRELNKTQHFLTASTLEQVDALVEQGRQTDAARVAIEAYHNALMGRAPQIEETLRGWEWLWTNIKRATAEAVDGMVEAFRDPGLAEIERRIAGFRAVANDPRMPHTTQENARRRIAGLEQRAMPLRRELVRAGLDAADRAEEEARLARYEQRRKASEEWDRIALSNLDKRAKLEREIAQIRELGVKAGKSEAEIQAQIAAARARHAESERRGGGTDPGESLLNRLERRIALNNEALALDRRLTDAEREILSVEQEIERLGPRLSASRRAQLELKLAEAKATSQLVQEREKERRVIESLTRLREQLKLEESNQQARNAADLMGLWRSSEAVESLNRQIAIWEWYAEARRRLMAQAARENREVMREEEEQLKASLEHRLEQEALYQYRRRAMLEDWQLGAHRAWEEYRDQALNVAGMVEDALTSAFRAAEDAFVQFAMTGKLSFRSLADSIISDLARIAARQLVSGLFGQVFGSLFFNTRNGIGAPIQVGSSIIPGFAKGGVIHGSPDLSAYSGQIVDRPTLFAFAKGAGLMGEAGPEAILPLKRTQGGQLGVVATGVGGDLQVVVNNYAGAQVKARQEQGRGPDGHELRRLILDIVADDAANGGRTWQAIKHRGGLREAV